MAKNVIFHHEDWQQEGFVSFISREWDRWQDEHIPSVRKNNGMIKAEINQGRWIVNCPSECGDAVISSKKVPYYICSMCGNVSNDGKWYLIQYPKDKMAIENVLLKRPAIIPFHAKTRNWFPNETVEDLEKENAERGLV